MPGLFDNDPNNNQSSGLGAGIGGILRGIGSVLSPQAYQQNTLYNAYRQAGLPDEMARAGSLDPQALQGLWQQKIFHDTFDAVKQQFPKISDAEILTRMSSPGGLEGLFVPKPFGEYKGASGASAPGMLQGSTVTPPPGMGFGSSSTAQAQPTQQPAAISPQPQGPAPISPVDQAGINYNAAKAAAVASAEANAKAQPDLPVLQNRTKDIIGKLERIRDNPELPNVVGGPLGIKGRTGPLGQGQSDLVNDIQDANNALQGDLFTSMRSVSGRGISPGALKEMRITDLQAGRTGTLPGYKDNINKTIKQIQDEYGAAWEARGSPDPYKPNWGTNAAAAQQQAATHALPPPAAAAYLKSNPHLGPQFDAKYGTGAAMRVLGQ